MARPGCTLLGGRGRWPHGRLRGSGAEADGVPRATGPSRGGLSIHGGPEPAPRSDSAAIGQSRAFRTTGSLHRRRSERPVSTDVGRTRWDGPLALQPSVDASAPAGPVRARASARATRPLSPPDAPGAPTG